MSELLARGRITIAVVNDGYSISLTAPSISIPANHDGSKPDLSNACTDISIYRGNKQLDFEIVDVVPSANGIQYTTLKTERNYKVTITNFPSSVTSGYLEIKLKTEDEYVTSVRFVFSVIKHATGLEWIDEWNGTYTQIGDNYVITPRLFAGHKTADGKITGIYLGKYKGYLGQALPYKFESPEEGIYGYVDNKVVFYINNLAARIAGWQITPEAIQCIDGTLTIKSEGSISSQNNNIVNWRLNKDGSAMFANGKVTMDAAGNASFDGKITARSGEIAGWTIGSESIYKIGIAINSAKRFIAVSNVTSAQSTGTQLDWVKTHGGVAMYYISNADYGFVGYKGNLLTFQAGSKNYIAGWTFDDSALWLGTKNNNMGQYAAANSIVVGSNGIRGNKFYFDKDGKGSLAGGNITWDVQGNIVFSNNVVINWANISGAIGNKLTKIDSNGIYTGTLTAQQVNALTCTFVQGTIGGWNISSDRISKNNVVLGSDGSISNGAKWKLNNDGSGYLANGNIVWNIDGTFKAKNGVFTGEIHADKGTIGGIELYGDHIGVTSSALDSGDAAWAALSIYKDFFKVGGGNGYVMFGNNVMPKTVTMSSLYTATGRIVNKAPNTSFSSTYDRANYGLLINVSGGTKNYGVMSDAALMAPSFINTRAQILVIQDGVRYDINYAQHNYILLSYNGAYASVNIDLPKESIVAPKFGLDTLPNDFASVVTFRVRPGSKLIYLKGIYDHNENLENYAMEPGDSITVLITKIDGFRYQLINHQWK